MNSSDFEYYCQKLNVLMEIKVFKKLEKVHNVKKHESKDVFSCEFCCLLADEIMESYLYQNLEKRRIQETINDLEKKESNLNSKEEKGYYESVSSGRSVVEV